MEYAYARVSTKGQNLDRQIIDLVKEGIKKKNIFIDKESGKDFNRCAYKKLYRKLKEGDLLIIKSLDRLGRDYKLIKEEWNKITLTKKANIKVIDMPLLCTYNSYYGQQMLNTLITNLALELLAYLAEYERNCIKQRQKEGIKAAKDRGVKFGRKPIVIKKEDRYLFNDYLDNKISKREIKERLHISNTTFYKLLNEIKTNYKE